MACHQHSGQSLNYLQIFFKFLEFIWVHRPKIETAYRQLSAQSLDILQMDFFQISWINRVWAKYFPVTSLWSFANSLKVSMYVLGEPSVFLKPNPAIWLRFQVHYWFVASGLLNLGGGSIRIELSDIGGKFADFLTQSCVNSNNSQK